MAVTLFDLMAQIKTGPIRSVLACYDETEHALRFDAFVQETRPTDYGSETHGAQVGLLVPYRDLMRCAPGYEAQMIATRILVEFETTA